MNDFPELERRYADICWEFSKLEMEMIDNIERNIRNRKVRGLYNTINKQIKEQEK